jgi:hypothetical protein
VIDHAAIRRLLDRLGDAIARRTYPDIAGADEEREATDREIDRLRELIEQAREGDD